MSREPGFLGFFDSRVGRTVRDHDILQDGDRLLVASICARDALPLLTWLTRRRTRGRVAFTLQAAVLLVPGTHAPEAWRRALEVAGGPGDGPVLERPLCVAGGGGCAACRERAVAEAGALARHEGASALVLADTLDDVAGDVLFGLVAEGTLPRRAPRSVGADGLRVLRPFAETEGRLVRRYARDLDLPGGPAACGRPATAEGGVLAALLATLGGRASRLKFNVAHAAARAAVVTEPGSR